MSSSASSNPTDLPPFQLEPLINNLNEPLERNLGEARRPTDQPLALTVGTLHNLSVGNAALVSRTLFSRVSNATSLGRDASKSSGQSLEVRCAQGLGRDLYIGYSNGTLTRHTLQDGSTTEDSHQLISRQTLPGDKAIDEIVLLPTISKALVLSGNIIYFYTLPSLDPIPATQISPLRAVVTFTCDARDAWRESLEQSAGEPVNIYVFRRKGITVYRLKEQLRMLKDVPLPPNSAHQIARRIGRQICVADSETYSMIDPEESQLFPIIPISQAGDDPFSANLKPLICSISENELILLSWLGNATMGLFLNENGDPIRGTLEWPEWPLALCADYPYVAVLLPSNTIEICSILTLSTVQTISCSAALNLRGLSSSVGGYFCPSAQRQESLRLVMIPLFGAPALPPSDHLENGRNETSTPAPNGEPASGSGLTPPPTPPKTPYEQHHPSSSYVRSRMCVIGSSGLQSLLPSTLISQSEFLFESHRIGEIVDLVDHSRKKVSAEDLDQMSEIRYVHERLGYYYLSQTLFEDAGNHFFKSETDPRLLIRLFPDLCDSLISKGDHAEVFKGVEEQARSVGTINEIIMANLVRNYHPHLDVETSPATVELLNVLLITARDMLRKFLHKTRNFWRFVKQEPVDASSHRVVDTVLAKLLADAEDTPELLSLIDSSDYIDVSQLEPLLIQHGQYSALAKIYEKQKEETKLLELWSRIADGTWLDPSFGDVMPQIITALGQSRNQALVQRYGLWLVKRDPPAGLKLFMSRDGNKRGMKFDDMLLLQELKAADAASADTFLEHLVLQKQNQDPALHTELATRCLDRLFAFLREPDIAKEFDRAVSTYPSVSSTTPYLLHLARSSLHPKANQARLQAALFLQGSALYDVEPVQNQILSETSLSKYLQLERAIVDSKLGKHYHALRNLVDLRDYVSAQSYCTLRGVVVSNRVAQAVAEAAGLQAWTRLFPKSGAKGREVHPGIGAAADQIVEKELVAILLKVYVEGGENTASQAARFINAQALHLSVPEVILQLPPELPLSTITPFMSRALRRNAHEEQEGQILKALSFGQNLYISDRAWTMCQRQVPRVEGKSTAAQLAGEAGNAQSVPEYTATRSSPAESTIGRIEVSSDEVSDLDELQ